MARVRSRMYWIDVPSELLFASRRASSVESATNTLRATAQSEGCAARPAEFAAPRISLPLIPQSTRMNHVMTDEPETALGRFRKPGRGAG